MTKKQIQSVNPNIAVLGYMQYCGDWDKYRLYFHDDTSLQQVVRWNGYLYCTIDVPTYQTAPDEDVGKWEKIACLEGGGTPSDNTILINDKEVAKLKFGDIFKLEYTEATKLVTVDIDTSKLPSVIVKQGDQTYTVREIVAGDNISIEVDPKDPSIIKIHATGTGESKLPRVSTMDPSEILSKSAVLHGFVTSLGIEIEPVDVYFEYYPSDKPTEVKKTESKKVFSLVEFTYKISGLTPIKKYKYRAVVKGSSGTSFGEFVEFESAGYLPVLCITKKYIGNVDDFENSAISYKNLIVVPSDTVKIDEDRGVVNSITNNGHIYSMIIEDTTPEAEKFIRGCGEFNMIIPRINIDKPTDLNTLTLSSDNSSEIYQGKELIISDNFNSYYRTVDKFETFSSVDKFEKEYFVGGSNISIDSVAVYGKTNIRAMILNNHKVVGNGKILYSIDGGQWLENPTDLAQIQFRKIVATNSKRFYAIADTDELVMAKRRSLICIPSIDGSPQGVNYTSHDTNGITALAFGQGTAVASRENGKLIYESDANQRTWVDYKKDTKLTNEITVIKSNSINYEVYPLWVIADALGNVSYSKNHITSSSSFTAASNNEIFYNSTHPRDIALIKGNTTNAVFACRNAKIFYTDDSFASIRLATIKDTIPTTDMHFNVAAWCPSNKSFIVAGNYGIVLESFDMGKTWTLMEVDGLGTSDVVSLAIVDDTIMMGASNGNLYTRKLSNFFTIDFTDNPLREIPVHVANGGQKFRISISDLSINDFKEAEIISTNRLGNVFNFKTDFVESVGNKARFEILITNNNTLTSAKLELFENRVIE